MSRKSEEVEADRYAFFSQHPGQGALIVLAGLSIPAATLLVLALLAPDLFFGSTGGRLMFVFLLACAAGLGALVFTSLQKHLSRQASVRKENAD
ncbi:MAG: hypothetical protein ACFHX7_08035 [Pseudomonadota bacterium]